MKGKGIRTDTTIVMTAEEFFTSEIEQVILFGVADKSSLLSLPRQLPDFWSDALNQLDKPKRQVAPVQTLPYETSIGLSVSTWHAGADYLNLATGRPESIIRLSDLTANEREHLTIDNNKHVASGWETLGITTKPTSSIPKTAEQLLSDQDFVLSGFVAVKRRINQTALRWAKHALAKDLHLIIISQYSPDFIAALCRRQALAEKSTIFIDAAQLIANLSPTRSQEMTAARSFGNLTPDTVAALQPYILPPRTHCTDDAKRLLRELHLV